MQTIELQLDEHTFERAKRIAASRGFTLEGLIKEIISQLGEAEAVNDPFLGMFVQEPELIDRVMDSVMRARKEHPLRQNRG